LDLHASAALLVASGAASDSPQGFTPQRIGLDRRVGIDDGGDAATRATSAIKQAEGGAN
jgi:hypothetical protein